MSRNSDLNKNSLEASSTQDTKDNKIKNPALNGILNLLHGFLKGKKVWVLLAVILLIVVFIFLKPFKASTSGIPTYKVKKDNFPVTITESGEIAAKNAVSISTPRVRGSLKIVFLIAQGTYVKPGDTVAKFDPTEAVAQLKDAESKLEVALSEKEKLLATHKSNITRLQSDMKSADLQFQLSKLTLEQVKFEAEVKQQEAKLQHQRNELSYQKAKQEYESQVIIQKSELNKTDIETQQKRTDLQKAKRDLEFLTLTAPKEGLVVYETNWNTGRKVAIGDTPWPGMTIISLPDLSAMQSITNVNEVDVSKIHNGQKVLVKLDAFQDSTFTGIISATASLGKNKDQTSTVKVFEIQVDIKSQSDILKPGMTTSNKIVITEIPNVLFVPQEAVFSKNNKTTVYLKNGSGFIETEIKIGEKSEDYIVIQSGLKVGDEVALRNPFETESAANPTETKSTKDISPEVAVPAKGKK